MEANINTIHPIGFITSCYKQKFGIPRQPSLVKTAKAILKMVAPYNQPEYIRGITKYSHIWIIFQFHQSSFRGKATIRPPRLGGNQRLGVFASRSNFRPNNMGMSVVKLESIKIKAGDTWLYLSGIDFLEGTPVIDIKPYLPYVDRVETAYTSFASTPPANCFNVVLTESAEQQCQYYALLYDSCLKQLIIDTLGLDPRPAYKQGTEDKKKYAMRLYEIDIHWQYEANHILVVALVKA